MEPTVDRRTVTTTPADAGRTVLAHLTPPSRRPIPAMNALAPYIAALHQQNLLEEAELLRFARRSRSSDPGIAAWRRGLGGGAHRLSGMFASAARSLDPSLEHERVTHRTSERTVGRALAC